jgi:hypothetical protein
MTPPTVPGLGPVRSVPIGSVSPYPGNPRRISDQAVEVTAASIAEFGWQQPIVVDTDRVVVVGHVRLKAARRLGLTEVPIVVADGLSPEQVQAYRIGDNRAHDYTTWDYERLASELVGMDDFAEVLQLADWQSVVAAFGQVDTSLPIDEHTDAVLGAQHALTVVFLTAEAADEAAPVIATIPGVVNVRHTRPPTGRHPADGAERHPAPTGAAEDSPAAG